MDWFFVQFVVDQFVGCFGGGWGGQGVDYDLVVVVVDEGDVGQVEVVYLVDIFGNFEQVVFEIEQGLVLQVGIDVVVGFVVEEEVVVVELLGDVVVGVVDEYLFWVLDQVVFGVFEVGLVGEW